MTYYTSTARSVLKHINMIIPDFVSISTFLPWAELKAPGTNDFQRGPKGRTQVEHDHILMLFIQHAYLFAEKPLVDDGTFTDLDRSMLRSASSDFVEEEPSPIRRR